MPGHSLFVGRHQDWQVSHYCIPLPPANLDSDIEIWDQTISNRHLHIYAIDYASDNNFLPVAPLVFVEDLSTNGTILERLEDVIDPGIPARLTKLSKHDGPILLNHGDKLRVSPSDWFEYYGDYDRWKNTSVSSTWATQAEDRDQFAHLYSITKRLIGVGGTSTVHLGYEQKQSIQVACKITPIDFSAHGKDRLLVSATATERLRYHVPEIEFLEEMRHVCQSYSMFWWILLM